MRKAKEIEELKRDFEIVDQECSRLEKKEAIQDEIIELMAEQLAGLPVWNNEKKEALILGDKEEVKQYFEGKANLNIRKLEETNEG